MKRQKKRVVPTAEAALKRHFRTHPLHDLVTANRRLYIENGSRNQIRTADLNEG